MFTSIPKLRNIFALMLLLGLIFAELLPGLREYEPSAAHSQAATGSSLFSSLFSQYNDPSYVAPNPAQTFLDLQFPYDPAAVSRDTREIFYLSGNASNQPSSDYITSIVTDNPTTPTTTPSNLLSTVLPPSGSALYAAYQAGGKAWYQKNDNVLVLMPDESVRSFNRKTGAANDWLRAELAYAPVNDPDALLNYQKNYRAEVVAETSKWVLMEFPSGGVLKVIKPNYATPSQPAGGSVSGNLPNILPGYN